MTMRITNFICPHCGRTGQGYLTWDREFEFNCYCCSCVSSIPDKEIPPELMSQKHRYSVNVLKSNGIPQSNFPRYTNKGIKE
jgi:hypothetical protein